MGTSPRGQEVIRVHGHRGARAVRPENTIAAFEYAISIGVDVLELDMNVTKDDVIVVSHDPILEPPIASGPAGRAVIREHTLAELRQWDVGGNRNPRFPRQQLAPGSRLPTLDEVFALAGRGAFDFNIETKITPEQPDLAPPPAEFVRLVLALIRKHRLERRVILQSFDFRTLHEMRRQAPEIALSALYEGAPRSLVEIAKEAAAAIVSPEFPLATAEQVQEAHAAGLQVIPWTPNQPSEWNPLIEASVDAIITDDPEALIAHLKNEGAS